MVIAVVHGLIDSGDVTRHLGADYRWAISAAQMLATALFAFRIFQLRRGELSLGESWRQEFFVWLLISAGFAFLPLDEAFSLHGKLDRLIHRVFAMTETALSDRIDAAIIALYGIVGLAVLWHYRRELRRFDIRRWLISGFLFLACAVLFDAVSDGPAFALSVVGDYHAAEWWTAVFAVTEACTQLVASSFFLVAFHSACAKAREGSIP